MPSPLRSDYSSYTLIILVTLLLGFTVGVCMRCVWKLHGKVHGEGVLHSCSQHQKCLKAKIFWSQAAKCGASSILQPKKLHECIAPHLTWMAAVLVLTTHGNNQIGEKTGMTLLASTMKLSLFVTFKLSCGWCRSPQTKGTSTNHKNALVMLTCDLPPILITSCHAYYCQALIRHSPQIACSYTTGCSDKHVLNSSHGWCTGGRQQSSSYSFHILHNLFSLLTAEVGHTTSSVHQSSHNR